MSESAFGVDHGSDISKMVKRAVVRPAPGVRGKLRRVKANAQLTGVNATNKLTAKAFPLAAALPRLHV